MIFTTARDLALSTISAKLVVAQESDDEQYADFAKQYVASAVERFEHFWALSDGELSLELRMVREGQRLAADDRDWDEYEGWEHSSYEIYAVQGNREALAEEVEQARLLSEPVGGLTHRPFAGLKG